MLVSDFEYELPEELIAQQPPEVRGGSRMLRLDRRTGAWADHLFADLPALLKPGDLLVLNDSRVLPARLWATRAGLRTQKGQTASGSVEVLLTEAMPSSEGQSTWRALVKPAKKVLPGEVLRFGLPGVEAPLLEADVVEAGEFGERLLRFREAVNLLATLERIGSLPLPPYIRRDRSVPNTEQDRSRYQTVFAGGYDAQGTPGSAAAPTAGLHFTPEILSALQTRGVETARITLHVGLGTFQPVRAERTEEIVLHREPFRLTAASAEALNQAWAGGRRIVAVGTTTTRTLEHLARRFEAAHGPLSRANPLRLEPTEGATGLFLSPGPDGDDQFKLVSGLVTNFHLPQSTLVMLVSAFAGRRSVLAAYAHAVAERYRFFSYGDCMLVL